MVSKGPLPGVSQLNVIARLVKDGAEMRNAKKGEKSQSSKMGLRQFNLQVGYCCIIRKGKRNAIDEFRDTQSWEKRLGEDPALRTTPLSTNA